MNDLPEEIRCADPVNSFKSLLKTHFYPQTCLFVILIFFLFLVLFVFIIVMFLIIFFFLLALSFSLFTLIVGL